MGRRKFAGWLGAGLLAMGWLESCGAMSIEPATPEEPIVAAPPSPRLTRRDAGIDAASKAEEAHP